MTKIVGNCLPFGLSNSEAFGWGKIPYFFFQYKNLPAVTINPGDVLAFDLGAVNDYIPAFASIALATPAQDTAGTYTTIVTDSAGSGYGDTILDNFDLRFTITNKYIFAGGDLIIRFEKGGNAAISTGFSSDGSCTEVVVGTYGFDSSGWVFLLLLFKIIIFFILIIFRFFYGRYFGDNPTTSGNTADSSFLAPFAIYPAVYPASIADLLVTTVASSSQNVIGPSGVAISPNLKFALIVDKTNHNLKKMIRSTNELSLIAGSSSNTPGSANGFGAKSSFNTPTDVAISLDNSYALVADYGNHQIRKLDLLTTYVSVFAGGSGPGNVNAIGALASFNHPSAVTFDPKGIYVLIADSGNNQIRKAILTTGEVSLFAGSSSGLSGLVNDIGFAVKFNNPVDIDISPSGKSAFICDSNNNQIRKIILSTRAVSTFAGQIDSGNVDAIGSNSKFNNPTGITISSDYSYGLVADANNNRIRKIILSTGEVNTFSGFIQGNEDGVGTNVKYNSPVDVVLSPTGRSALVADFGNSKTRKIQILSPPKN